MRCSLALLGLPLLAALPAADVRQGPLDSPEAPVDSPEASVDSPEASGRGPNLLVFLVDDLGWQDVSLPLHDAPTPRNALLHTPNVERLAASGVTFTNGYASAPVCTPTRTSLMTGRSPAATHITYWILHAGRDTSAEFPGLRPPEWDLDGLQPEDETLAHRLRGAGYRTIHVGKSHLGGVGSPGADPLNLGFSRNVAGHGAGAPASYLGREGFSRERDGEPSVWNVPGLERYHGQDVYLTEALAMEAEREVREAEAAGEPWFLHFAPYAVHTPITANPSRVERYAGLPAREAAYASMIESVDAALGELLDLLDELEIADETWVVFTSDNGGLSAHGRDGERHTHNAPLRSGKGSAYEGGLRVPWVIAGPGVPEPRRCDTPVVIHDLYPTLLGWAGQPVGAEGGGAGAIEGRDLTPLLTGDGGAFEARGLFWHQPHFWGIEGPGIWPFSAVRQGRWKLIHRHADGGFELYDLVADVGEREELSVEEPERVRELARELAGWMEEVGAQRSIDAETGEPVAWPGR